MAITVTPVANGKTFDGPGKTWIEYSITFDSAYATTGGESLAFGSTTNFASKIRECVITRIPQEATCMYNPVFVPGTSDGATNAKMKLFRARQAVSNQTLLTWNECSTTNNLLLVKMRAKFRGW